MVRVGLELYKYSITYTVIDGNILSLIIMACALSVTLHCWSPDSVMGHFVSNHCRELGLVQETDLELILH